MKKRLMLCCFCIGMLFMFSDTAFSQAKQSENSRYNPAQQQLLEEFQKQFNIKDYQEAQKLINQLQHNGKDLSKIKSVPFTKSGAKETLMAKRMSAGEAIGLLNAYKESKVILKRQLKALAK